MCTCTCSQVRQLLLNNSPPPLSLSLSLSLPLPPPPLSPSLSSSLPISLSSFQPERLQGSEYTILSDIWSLGISLVEMALGRYPIPQPPPGEIAEEMKQRPAGTVYPPRAGGNPFASHAHAIRMPIFELLQIIFTSVRM